MSKSKVVLLSLLAVVIAAAIAVGVVGCANKAQPAAVTPQPSVSAPATSGVSAQSGQYNPQQMQNNIKTALASLVSKGTITQAQANQVVQSYAKRQPSSNHQPSSGYQQGSGQRQNPILTQLVSNGTLTQTQATAVNQAISQAMPHRRPGVATSGQTSPGTTTQ